jgi:hypothetical protein
MHYHLALVCATARAQTQNDLGNVLAMLGERESGTVHLTQAVAAYRAALEERTRDRVPHEWARTQNDLGNALCTLSKRESGTAHLTEAISAWEAAVTVSHSFFAREGWMQEAHSRIGQARTEMAQRMANQR